MFGRSSKKRELEERIEELKRRIETLESEREALKRELAKERERGRKAKSELQEVEVLLKNAEKRVLTLENELKRLKEKQSEHASFKDVVTLRDTTSLELLSKIGSVRSKRRDLLTIYLGSGERVADLERSGEMPVLGEDLEHLLSRIESDTGIVVFHDVGRIFMNTLVAVPPFPLDTSGWRVDTTFDTDPLERLILKDRTICILLSHAGETFIGVSNRDGFLEDTIVRSSVKEKHTKGGWSQKRFSRLREEDIRNHISKVAETLAEIIERWRDSTEIIIAGGEYNLIRDVLEAYHDLPQLVRGIDARIGKDKGTIDEIRAKVWSLRWYVLG
ncbi:MAG TPA: hypothetical protein ENI32_00550 [Candidatus Syntrophoarchaeum butanivorans]|uniref:ERF1 domain protein 2 domain protein n=1 Tax=Candidatus Syntropharchaeum butanivorans TaxID=1839936 RepID=A0A1F2P650_9EURY|nr:MAG: eRF1 domain protein 2 domain protein [Candidatus Syntrophoarchaeum butanivorans]HEC56370.1 hypothetical protein [Candidatus Syntrophoarchaeum butanivorans]